MIATICDISDPLAGAKDAALDLWGAAN